MFNIGLYSPSMQMGKSTLAKYLMENYNLQPVVLAYTLKRMIEVFLTDLGYSQEMVQRMVYGDLKEWIIPEIGKSTRELMQTLGTEWGRQHVHPDIWVIIAGRRVAASVGNLFVSEDIRFKNEADAFRKEGFKIIKINNPRIPVARKHASEGGLDDYEFDYSIENDGTFENYFKKIEEMITYFAEQEGR